MTTANTSGKQVAKAAIVLPQNQEHSLNPVQLIQVAVQQGFDLDRLQKLIDMQEQWERKQAKKSFLAALSRFQTMVPVLKKSKTAKVQTKSGGSYSYQYADLGTITQSIKGALAECGLSYRWEFAEDGGKMKVTCHISHIDGHTETATMEAAADNSGAKNDIQQKGSTHTYLQRYTLIGALGLSTADEDDDGSARRKPKQQEAPVEQTEEDVLDQWRQVLQDCKTKIHLNSVYLQNKKVVDASPKVQALFKAREAELKSANEQISMP